MLIGQDKISQKLNSLTAMNCPQSLILCGTKGCGKHTVIKDISNKLNLDVQDITLNLTYDYIEDIYISTQPFIYLIDIDHLVSEGKRVVRGENVILKLLEEPPTNAYIIILCQKLSQMLPTVINRCQVWEFERYDQDILKSFITTNVNPIIVSIADTPGKIIQYQKFPIDKINELCTKIVERGYHTNFANLLSVANMINFNYDTWDIDTKYKKGDVVVYEGKLFECLQSTVGNSLTTKEYWQLTNVAYDFDCVVELLLRTVLDKIKHTECDSIMYAIYDLTSHLSNDRFIANINKKTLFTNYLCQIKLLCR